MKDYLDKIVLTDEEIEYFGKEFAQYVKSILTEKYIYGMTSGDYWVGNHFNHNDMVDAATYGATAMYDLLYSKIADCYKYPERAKNGTISELCDLLGCHRCKK